MAGAGEESDWHARRAREGDKTVLDGGRGGIGRVVVGSTSAKHRETRKPMAGASQLPRPAS